jgi:hypothetical protein
MKPLFFPFTYVTEPTINACLGFFNGISVPQASMKTIPEPMRQWADQGCLDVRVPGLEASRDFHATLMETENWARYHRGGVASFLKGYQEKVPFFGSSSISQIKQDIRTANREKPHDVSQEEAVLRARVFLHMAQEFDIHHQSLSQQMQQQEAMERNLYQELKGDESPSDRTLGTDKSWDKDDPFEYMMLDRLRAWSHVTLSHGHIQGPLVTTYASVLALIQEHVLDTESLIPAGAVAPVDKNMASAKKERQNLEDFCENLIKTPMSHLTDSGLLDTYPAEAVDTYSMKLYLLPDIATHDFIARFLGVKFKGTHDNLDISDAVNTLIGYIPVVKR